MEFVRLDLHSQGVDTVLRAEYHIILDVENLQGMSLQTRFSPLCRMDAIKVAALIIDVANVQGQLGNRYK